MTTASSWRELAPGIKYRDMGSNKLLPWSHIHTFKIDLKLNEFGIVMANDYSRNAASIQQFSKYSQALITINGGFFDQRYKPLGLRVSHRQEQSSLKQISWWGVFYINNQRAYLTNWQRYIRNNLTDFAVQSGPRLLMNGKILPLKPGFSERTALGITPNNRVIVLVSENSPMSTRDLAKLLQAPPLNCTHAINLDGGSSSQLNANIGNFNIHVQGFSKVSDAIIIKARTAQS